MPCNDPAILLTRHGDELGLQHTSEDPRLRSMIIIKSQRYACTASEVQRPYLLSNEKSHQAQGLWKLPLPKLAPTLHQACPTFGSMKKHRPRDLLLEPLTGLCPGSQARVQAWLGAGTMLYIYIPLTLLKNQTFKAKKHKFYRTEATS